MKVRNKKVQSRCALFYSESLLTIPTNFNLSAVYDEESIEMCQVRLMIVYGHTYLFQDVCRIGMEESIDRKPNEYVPHNVCSSGKFLLAGRRRVYHVSL